MTQKRKWVVVALFLALILGTVGAFASEETLNVWIATTFVDAQNNWLKAQAEAWADSSGVKINLSIFPKEIYADKIVAAIESGNPPDVVLQGAAGVVQAAEQGLLVPLTSVVNKLGRDDFYPAVLNYDALSDPNTGAKEIYGIPLFFELRTVDVRTDLLAKAGISIPEHPDYDWLVATARAVNDPPNVYGLGFPLGKCYDANDNILTLIYHFGGGYIANKGPHGADIFNTEPTWKAFSLLQSLYKQNVIPPDAVGWTDYDNNLAFMGGRIAFTINGLSIYYKMVKENNPLVKVTKEIFLDTVCDTGLKSAFVFKSTPQKEELGKDLLYSILSNKEAYRVNMCEASSLYGLPIFKSQGAIITQEWKDGKWSMFAVDPMSGAEHAKAVWAMAYPLAQPTSVAERVEGSLLIPENTVYLFTRNADPKQVAADIAAKINRMLSDTYSQ